MRTREVKTYRLICEEIRNHDGSVVLVPSELTALDGLTAGTVTASKLVKVDANKDIGDFRNLDAVNFDAGSSGVAGSVDIFPTTASKGKLTISCDDQTGDTAVTIKPNAMGQATTVNIPDPGAAASYVAQSTAALTLAEVDVLDAVTAGTVAASKAVVVDGSKNIGDFAALDAVDFDAGSSGVAGSVDIFPTTASKGKLIITCDDQTGDTNVTLKPNAMGQATTVNIPDPGAAASYVAQSTAALTLAEVDVLDAVTAGTVAASKAVVVDGSKNIGDFAALDAVDFDAGSSGVAGSVDIFPTTASKGKLIITCDDQTGDTNVTLKPNAMGQATTVNIPDPGAAASYVAQSTAALTLAEVDVLDAVTAGTVAASKAVVVDGSKNIGDFAALDAVDFDAGSSGVAGSVDIFPTTASKGKLIITCDDQTGDTNVTLKPNAMGQATTVNIPDPGAAASYVAQSTAALTLAEVDVLDAVTAGTVAASKAVVVDGSKNIGDFGTIGMSGALSSKMGAAASAVAVRLGLTLTEGLEIKVIDEDVTLTNAASTDLTEDVPDGAVILSVQGNLDTLVVGDASGDDGLVKVGIGVAADPDKYGLTGSLLQNQKIDTIPDWAVLSGAEDIKVYACDAAGAAVTEKFVAGGIVRVRIVYIALNSLDDTA